MTVHFFHELISDRDSSERYKTKDQLLKIRLKSYGTVVQSVRMFHVVDRSSQPVRFPYTFDSKVSVCCCLPAIGPADRCELSWELRAESWELRSVRAQEMSDSCSANIVLSVSAWSRVFNDSDCCCEGLSLVWVADIILLSYSHGPIDQRFLTSKLELNWISSKPLDK
jgi:hypothetical protein